MIKETVMLNMNNNGSVVHVTTSSEVESLRIDDLINKPHVPFVIPTHNPFEEKSKELIMCKIISAVILIIGLAFSFFTRNINGDLSFHFFEFDPNLLTNTNLFINCMVISFLIAWIRINEDFIDDSTRNFMRTTIFISVITAISILYVSDFSLKLPVVDRLSYVCY